MRRRARAWTGRWRGRQLYVQAGADAIFPEALHDAEMFREFARRMPGVPLLANMTEFGRTPFFTAAEFQEMGYRMVIWPVSEHAGGEQGAGGAVSRRSGAMAGRMGWWTAMQTRAELYADDRLCRDMRRWTRGIVSTVVPKGMPQRG